MFIDPHVHCRGGKNQAHKDTVAHALKVAERAGATAIFDMPNTDPPLLNLATVVARLAEARAANSPVYYGVYAGIIPDERQIAEAVNMERNLDGVIGIKMYAGHSTGNMGIIDEAKQQFCYQRLAKEGYKGVLAVHCEKESLIDRSLFKYEQPWTHCNAQPPLAEVESLRDQIRYSGDAGFEGNLHIAHISVPEAVELVNEAKKHRRITSGITFHHLFLSDMDMHWEDGLLLKMNPPLRPDGMQRQNQEYLRIGMIDWVESDHAPHTIPEKEDPSREKPFASGVPGLQFWPRALNWFRRNGFTDDIIQEMTFDEPNKVYGLNLKPRAAAPQVDLAGEYPFDPFRHLKF